MNSRRDHIILITTFLATFTALLMWAGASLPEEPDVPGPPPGTYKVHSDDGEIEIPFVIFRDDILMLARVNGVQLRMLLDNGSLWDQLLFFGSPTIDSIGLDYDSEIQVGGSGEDDPVMSDMASDVTIRFSEIEFFGQPAITTPYSSGITSLWEGSDGQVSAAFFKHFVVDINFDEGVIRLIPPDEFTYAGEGVEIPMTPASFGSWTVPGTLEMDSGEVKQVDLMLDLGDLHALSLTTGPTYGIEVPDEALETSLGFGVQGEIKGHLGRVRSVLVGGYTFDNVLAGFQAPDGDGRTDDDAYIGFGLLSRFNVVFDYNGKRMFVEPNRRFSEPFEYNMSGMMMRPGAEGAFVVVKVYPGSPADEAGLKRGDLITHIDGEPTAGRKTWDFSPLFLEEGRTLDLGVSSGGEARVVSIVLRRMI